MTTTAAVFPEVAALLKDREAEIGRRARELMKGAEIWRDPEARAFFVLVPDGSTVHRLRLPEMGLPLRAHPFPGPLRFAVREWAEQELRALLAKEVEHGG